MLIIDWVLKTDQDLDGVPLSYIDMMERTESEERRREREKKKERQRDRETEKGGRDIEK